MKELENREFWIRQTTTLLAMSINRYLCIALYFHSPGFFGFGRILTPPEPNGPRPVFALAQTHRTGYLN